MKVYNCMTVYNFRAFHVCLSLQRTASSSSLASSNENTEVKLETTKSLIDFDDEPEPPVAPAVPQIQQATVAQSVVQPANSSDDNWASFDVASGAKATQGPSNLNPLDSVLSQLSVPSPAPTPISGIQGDPNVTTIIPASIMTLLPKPIYSSVSPAGPLPASAIAANASGPGTVGNFSTLPPSGASVTVPGLTMSPLNNAGQWANMQHQQPVFPTTASQPTSQQFTPSVSGSLNNQVVLVE